MAVLDLVSYHKDHACVPINNAFCTRSSLYTALPREHTVIVEWCRGHVGHREHSVIVDGYRWHIVPREHTVIEGVGVGHCT